MHLPKKCPRMTMRLQKTTTKRHQDIVKDKLQYRKCSNEPNGCLTGESHFCRGMSIIGCARGFLICMSLWRWPTLAERRLLVQAVQHPLASTMATICNLCQSCSFRRSACCLWMFCLSLALQGKSKRQFLNKTSSGHSWFGAMLYSGTVLACVCACTNMGSSEG